MQIFLFPLEEEPPQILRQDSANMPDVIKGGWMNLDIFHTDSRHRELCSGGCVVYFHRLKNTGGGGG